jgi:hypothetical protein
LLANDDGCDCGASIIRLGFLNPESRQDLIELTRDGSAAHRLYRRANDLVLPDDGMSYEAIAKMLFVDDDAIRDWYQRYQEDAVEALTIFDPEGACADYTPPSRSG